MELKKLKFQSKLTVVELGTFMSEFNRIFSLPIDEPAVEDRDLLIEDVYLGNKGKFFRTALEAYESCIKRIRKMDQTESMTQYNKLRIKDMSGTISYICSNVSSNDADKAEAAVLLKDVVNEFRNYHKLNCTALSTHISRFIETLRQEKYAEAYEALALDDRISELERVNNEYKQLAVERAEAKENIPDSPSETRQKCVSAYRDLVDLINFALANNEYYLYEEKAKQLAGITQTAQELINRRRGDSTEASEDTSEEITDTPIEEVA